MEKDIFCKIIDKEIPADFILENEEFIVIKDLHPKAPVHVLIIPKTHIDIIHEVSHGQIDLLGKMLLIAGQTAQKLGVEKTGYQLIINQGDDAGQTVPHLHMHLLAGEKIK